MRAGTLDKRVTIQQRSETRDSYGGSVVSWVDVATVWADVQHMSGREFLQAQATQDETTIRVVIRWRTGVTAGMRLVLQQPEQGGSPTPTSVLDVTAVLESGDRKRWLQLMCKAGINNG